MAKIQTRYETKLETADHTNIISILDAKLEATSPEGVVDYVSFALDNQDAKIDRMKLAIKELGYLIKLEEQQKEIIKLGTVVWLTESGINSLSGDIASSMKITQPKPKENLIVHNEEALINQGYFKTVLDKTAVKQAILDGVEVEGAEIEVVHQEETLTVYKRRKSAATSEES